MSIEFDVSHNLFDFEKFLANYNQNVNVPVLRRAVNRAALSVRKEGMIEIQKHLKIGSMKLRKRIKISKAKAGFKGNSRFKDVEARVKFSNKRIPLIDFVVGSKTAKSQKGVKVENRKRLKVQIQPGRKIELRKAFIARVKTKQVFNRRSNGKDLRKQATISPGRIVQSPKHRIIPKLRVVAQTRFRQVFTQEINARLNKTLNRRKRKLRKAL